MNYDQLLMQNSQNSMKRLRSLIASLLIFGLTAPVAAFAQPIKLEIGLGPDTDEVVGLASYIVALYEYIVGAIGVVAAIMIMVAGIRWAGAAGNADQVGRAKREVIGALTGLILALLSYVILVNINPATVNFGELEVPEINAALIEEGRDEQGACTEKPGNADDEACTERMAAIDERFTRGNSKTAMRLNESAALNWNELAQDFHERFGKPVPINHGFRSTTYQACLASDPTADNPAGQCSSPHVKGAAVDVSTSSLTQAEYNFLVCGDEDECLYDFTPSNLSGVQDYPIDLVNDGYFQLGAKNTVREPNGGFTVLNYNPVKDRTSITEQHHFDHPSQNSVNVCTICPTNPDCSCPGAEEAEEGDGEGEDEGDDGDL